MTLLLIFIFFFLIQELPIEQLGGGGVPPGHALDLKEEVGVEHKHWDNELKPWDTKILSPPDCGPRHQWGGLHPDEYGDERRVKLENGHRVREYLDPDDYGPPYNGPQTSPFPEGPPTPLDFTPDMMHKGGEGVGNASKKSTSRRNAWGNLSYADLITQAILSSPEKRLTLSQVYDWMVQNIPYFKDKGDSNSSAGWKVGFIFHLSASFPFIYLFDFNSSHNLTFFYLLVFHSSLSLLIIC